jgi:hypothetical protein
MLTEADKNAIFDALLIIKEKEHPKIYYSLQRTYQKIYDTWINEL